MVLEVREKNGLYPIGIVAELTGVNPVTLRAWERRYGVIRPSRTDNGRRLYSSDEVEKIKTLLGLLDQGIAISRAAEALKKNIDIAPTLKVQPSTWEPLINRMMTAISVFDENLLDETYLEASSLYPIEVVTQKLLTPLLDILGERWDKTEGGVAEEHFFSMYMRNKLGARFHHQNRFATGAPVIVAGLPGERHEFGLLLLSLSMMNHGHKIILLGPDLPLDQLNSVVEKSLAKAIVLSGAASLDISPLLPELQRIAIQCKLPIFVGGKAVEGKDNLFDGKYLTAVGDDIRLGVNIIQRTLANA